MRVRRLGDIVTSLLFAAVAATVVPTASAQTNVPHNDVPDESITAPLPQDYHSPPHKPEKGKAIRKNAIDSPGPTASNFGVVPMQDDRIFTLFRGERLEYRKHEGEEIFLWDITTWVGDDYNKLYIESEGEHVIEEKTESAELQILYSRNVSTFWDVQAGVRYDLRPEPERFFAVLGVQGLAPQWFEIEADLYLSEEADVSAAIEAKYDVLLSQRLIAQPRSELQFAVQDVPEYGIGEGLRNFELGLRIRYELSRKFAPYVGVSWERLVGETANFAEKEDEETSKVFWLVGVRTWF